LSVVRGTRIVLNIPPCGGLKAHIFWVELLPLRCQSLTSLATGVISVIMPINVNLTPELEGLIRQKVSSGRYNSASEVVREALRLMEVEDQLRAAKLAQLRNDIQEGLHSGPARRWSVSEMKREGRKRLKTSPATSRK
jgi:antitoxin ParD1/3/4